ncbi:MAG: hypothetical protein AB1631_03205 [Acidobacteriota bacterium]
MNAKNSVGLILSLIIAAVFSSACVKPQEPPAQREAPVQQPPEPPPPPKPTQADLAPAKPEEAREALARVYQTAVTLEPNQKIITGDFNGDESPDIAMVVKPSESAIDEINSEVANWILVDPTKVVILKKTGIPPTPAPVKIEKTDTLIAVLHGHGPAGWRSKDSQQTWLLRNAAGSDMKLQPAKDAMRINRGKPDFPRLNGDVISQTLGGYRGFLYWTGAKYAWFATSGEEAAARSKE